MPKRSKSRKTGRLQTLRDFTVQIRATDGETIVGTGIVVSMDGKIVTCAHVVEAALGVEVSKAGRKKINIYFPQTREEKHAYKATVIASLPSDKDDVAVLRLTGKQTPLGPEQIAVLGTPDNSEGNRFRSYGYRELPPYQGLFASGDILGCIEHPKESHLQADPVQLHSPHVAEGMSGSGVLDEDRNLIVGIILESSNLEITSEDRDTAIAINASILKSDKFNLPVQDEPLPMRAAPTPKTNIKEARANVSSHPGIAWNDPPQPLDEWVGRVEFLKGITADWKSPDTRVTGLIGFGGEGKSSIARKWVDDILSDKKNKPDGVFWWGFYTKPSVDEFFEAALKYMSGGKIDPSKLPSAGAKAQVIGAMLAARRYLFVLDGLEILQHQESDRYGLLKSKDMLNFLEYFGGSDVKSFCLITSRAPIMDLISYASYRHRDVNRLLLPDGRELLIKIGVKGKDEALEKVVEDWDGHALTLSLLGSCIAEKYKGDISAADIELPEIGEDRYKRVQRVMRRYDEHLDKAERAFMTLFSAFRNPVKKAAFEKVFRTKTKATAINAPITKLTRKKFDAMIERLLTYRIIRYDKDDASYTSHPLIRNHYLAQFANRKKGQTKEAHEHIKDYYLEITGDIPHFPTLDDLAPLIEGVYHLCQAGAYDEAHEIRRDRIDQRNSRVLVNQLGAYETQLSIMEQFFPDSDISLEPQVSMPSYKSWILTTVGFCLMSLGRLSDATPFFERGNAMDEQLKDWKNASMSYQNLADLYISLGELEAGAKAAEEALEFAMRAEAKIGECNSLAYRAWVAHLRGDIKAASTNFKQTEKLEQEINPDTRYLYSIRGIQHADHLRRIGNPTYARKVTDANVAIIEKYHIVADLSRCHRILGDLDAEAKKQNAAREHYDEAIKIARGIQQRDVLMDALLARGRWNAKYMKDPDAAFSDLDEVFEYAVDGGYRIHEADIRIALAWAYLAQKDKAQAKIEADRAMTMSKEMGYHWGKVDAKEVLDKIKRKK